MLAATDVSADRCRCERVSLRRHRVVHLVGADAVIAKGRQEVVPGMQLPCSGGQSEGYGMHFEW